MSFMVNRRQASAIGIGALAGAALGLPGGPAGAANDAHELVRRFAGGREAAEDGILLDLPEIAENGNTVPIMVRVERPMTEQSYVTDVLIVADRNPRAAVVTFRFTPLSGVAEAYTRIRLAETQNIIAVARTSDGSIYRTSKQVKITIGGCGG